MKKLFLLSAVMAIVFTSCTNSGAFDNNKCMDSVKNDYPNSDIYTDMDRDFYFYVVDSSGIKIVKTMSINSPKVTSVIVLTKIQDK